MDLDQYLSTPDAPTVAQLRERMRELGYVVKSDAQIRQWRHRYGGRKPDPENCVGLELATNGGVPRTEFYPDDWQKIWPEFVPSGVHPTEPVAQSTAVGD
ncbi:transcriptional regulator [Caballeronia sordidicola]|uniref:transcriptional regulator n=1 Tax=Caballeronia sordidicola TaxID=196367 RepID=UPI000A85B43C|nr:hypothetical protein [Caballeronia sordidicola]